MVSSGTTSFSGGGRKSFTLVSFPIGRLESSLLLIVASPLSPISRPVDSDAAFPIRKANCQDLADAEQAFFRRPVLLIHVDFSSWVCKCLCRRLELHPMLADVSRFLVHIPCETPKMSVHHSQIRIAHGCIIVHTIIHITESDAWPSTGTGRGEHLQNPKMDGTLRPSDYGDALCPSVA